MRLFISYHLADHKHVAKIKEKLDSINVSYYSVPEDADFNGWSQQKISDFILSKMSNCTIILCVVGEETYSRPHVDYELHHSLKGLVGERLGMIALFLETRNDNKNDIDYNTFPPRIKDNKLYAVHVQNASFIGEFDSVTSLAQRRRNDKSIQVINNRPCMKLSSRKYYDSK